jgi:hypothetical protein
MKEKFRQLTEGVTQNQCSGFMAIIVQIRNWIFVSVDRKIDPDLTFELQINLKKFKFLLQNVDVKSTSQNFVLYNVYCISSTCIMINMILAVSFAKTKRTLNV